MLGKMKFNTTTKGIRGQGQSEREPFGGNVSVKSSTAVNPNKRRPEISVDGRSGKKQKLIGNSKPQVCKIPKELMNDQNNGNKNDEEGSFLGYMGNINGQNTKKIVENNHQKPIFLDNRHGPMSPEEKKKFRLELVQALSRKMTEKLRTVFRKFGFNGPDKERLDSYIVSTDDETLWKLRREVKVVLDGEVKPGRIALNKTVEKEQSSGLSALASPGVDSDGPGVVINGKNSPNATTPASVEDVQMSPKKALRAAMLKSRFADIIYKATHQGQESDPKQVEKKARTEAQIKAAEAALRRREQDDLRRRRERERMALEKMEKTVEIYENLDVMREFEMLICSPPSDSHGQLGLYIKDDSLEDEDAILDAEEGEILSPRH